IYAAVPVSKSAMACAITPTRGETSRFPSNLAEHSSISIATRGPLHSFPTRRSSDLAADTVLELVARPFRDHAAVVDHGRVIAEGDRKSTRLNSSHVATSYAVICFKKTKVS